jgi:LysR family glycine cleavage system transcriptional activator
LKKPADLAQETLIHDLSMDGHAGPSWVAWLQKAGVEGGHGRRGMKINNSAAVLQAAVEGHGIALARSVMARDDLAAGRLVRLFGKIRYAVAAGILCGVSCRVCRPAAHPYFPRLAAARGAA